jgi:RsiW-degrading membrane proteinase PrsW (M82 family)
MFWIGVGVLRAVSRGTRNQGQGQGKQEWPPAVKAIVAVLFFGIPIVKGGGWRTASEVILGLIFGSAAVVLVCAFAHAIVHRDAKPTAPADPLAEFFNERKD